MRKSMPGLAPVRVWDLRFRVWGLGLRFWGLLFRLWGLGKCLPESWNLSKGRCFLRPFTFELAVVFCVLGSEYLRRRHRLLNPHPLQINVAKTGIVDKEVR